jgi:hypothetical protein
MVLVVLEFYILALKYIFSCLNLYSKEGKLLENKEEGEKVWPTIFQL